MSEYDPYAPNANPNLPINTDTPVHGKVLLVPYDPAWPGMYEAEAAHIRAALGDSIRTLEHIGSTSVPGLIAKPCIDILLGVDDSAAESTYVPQLEVHGFVLRRREPDWHEHRVFKSKRINVNLHVFSDDSWQIPRHIAFRDWLRTHEEDRDLYARAKQKIAQQHFAVMTEYANAKDDVVQEITARIREASDANF